MMLSPAIGQRRTKEISEICNCMFVCFSLSLYQWVTMTIAINRGLILFPTVSNLDTLQELIGNEESTVYSQAIHYSNRMVYLRVPLDVAKGSRGTTGNFLGIDGESNSNSNFTNRWELCRGVLKRQFSSKSFKIYIFILCSSMYLYV